ncbi:MAG: hypothetical protein ISF22_08345 [Methanomassiliicoccus sp.]|nr:hypothetical protein [Methanomassiliicoccus sp.]
MQRAMVPTTEAPATVDKAAELRADILLDMGALVRRVGVGEFPVSVRLEVRFDQGVVWTEYVEPWLDWNDGRWYHAYLADLLANGFVVLHYPGYLIDERLVAQVGDEILDMAYDHGARSPVVWVFLYDPDGRERRVY